MADMPQSESGADVNALRNQIEVGGYLDVELTNAKQLPDGKSWVLTCEPENDGDPDSDTCTLRGTWTPAKGDRVRLHRPAETGALEAEKLDEQA